jgi:Lon-like ATP-dependent protease
MSRTLVSLRISFNFYVFSALNENQLVIQDNALETLIKHYCRESGVRSLQKHIEKIFRKAAYELIKAQEEGKTVEEPRSVATEDLQKLVGREKFTKERLYETTPPG